MQIQNLIIETTRNCQFECAHCLRGEAQKKEVRIEDICLVLDQVSYIGSITFSGGEPSLNTKAIRQTLDICKEKGVEVGSFYIATNGYSIPVDFVIVCLEWYSYCEEKELCSVEVSNDIYHLAEGYVDTSLLSGLSFFRKKYEKENEGHLVINEGLAVENGLGEKETENIAQDYCCICDGFVQEIELYLNCDGEIVFGCNWSYQNQGKYKICDASEFNMENLEKGLENLGVQVEYEE